MGRNFDLDEPKPVKGGCSAVRGRPRADIGVGPARRARPTRNSLPTWPYALRVGIVQTLNYQVPQPNAAQRMVWHLSASRPGSWLLARWLHRVDRLVLRLSAGRQTFAGLTAGIPVLTITTTGTRTGLRRTLPLLGVPYGDSIAIIGTQFGQTGTPGWYYNLRAQPALEVSYRDKNTIATAREAGAAEWQPIWDQARGIYAGYEAYARRIKGRDIHIMILSA